MVQKNFERCSSAHGTFRISKPEQIWSFLSLHYSERPTQCTSSGNRVGTWESCRSETFFVDKKRRKWLTDLQKSTHFCIWPKRRYVNATWCMISSYPASWADFMKRSEEVWNFLARLCRRRKSQRKRNSLLKYTILPGKWLILPAGGWRYSFSVSILLCCACSCRPMVRRSGFWSYSAAWACIERVRILGQSLRSAEWRLGWASPGCALLSGWLSSDWNRMISSDE